MNVDYQKDLDAFNLKYKDFVITSDLLTGNLLIDKQKELDIMKKEKQELQIKVNNYYIMVGNLNSLEERKKSLLPSLISNIQEIKEKCIIVENTLKDKKNRLAIMPDINKIGRASCREREKI